jgi:monoterpene epsilon-lactone hydrolase
MDTREYIEIPLDEQDAELLPALYKGFASIWADTSQQPRSLYDRFIAATPIAGGVKFRPAASSEPPGVWCEPSSANTETAMLYLHGGAYVMGSAHAYRGFVSQIAARAQCSAFILDYTLAPEATIPVAIEQARAAAEGLLAAYPRMVIAGDSAGGGLALATLAELPEKSRVDAAVLFSPWVDLTLSGRSVREKAGDDVLLTPATLAGAAQVYAGGLPLDDGRGSPLFGDPHGYPPILIQVGSQEILLDDSVRFAVEARNAGVPVTLELWQGMPHVFQVNVETLASSRRALDQASAFLQRAIVDHPGSNRSK